MSAATDAAGNIVWKENYRPFGERLSNQAESADNRQWFHGKAADTDTGLQYFGARYYDPVLCRFMGVDPVGFQEDNIHSFNKYAYGNNNPYRFIDPDGNQSRPVITVPPPPGGNTAAAIRNLQAGNLIAQIRTYNSDFSPSRMTESRGDQSFTIGEISNLSRIRDQYANGVAGRYIADTRGNVMFEPTGGSTVQASRTNSVDTHTTYPNGSTFQRLNPRGHKTDPTPHGHAHAPGTGPGMRGQGASLDVQGNQVPSKSPEAHFPIN
jgi:RHS repeat-associated protein